MRSKNGVCLLALVLLAGRPSAAEDLFDLQKVADGVYAALAKPRTPINCNAAVIVYDEGVLVVDTHSRPSSARALIQQIKTVTDKPVRYAVNTHFHWDHAQGNHAYPVAFPKQVAIVASEADPREPREAGDAAGQGPDRKRPGPGRGPEAAARRGEGRRGAGGNWRTSCASRRSTWPRSAAWS